MSSAQAAASAAFLASKTPTPQLLQKRKPDLRLNVDVNNSQSKIQTPGAGLQPNTPSARSQPYPETPTFNISLQRKSQSGTKSSQRTTPGTGPLSESRNGAVVRKGSRATPGIVVPQAARKLRGLRDLSTLIGTSNEQLSQLGNLDYFSLPRSSSVSSHDIVAETPKAKQSTKPQDMLEQVRHSINSKLKIGTGKDSARKSQLAINEVRQSIDLRRLLSQALILGGSREEIQKPPSNSSSRQSSAGEIYDAVANRSSSSMGSVISEVNGSSELLTPNFKFSYCDSSESVKKAGDIAENSKKGLLSPHDAPLPIPIPLSSQGVNRGLAAASSDSFAKPLHSPNTVTTSPDAVSEEEPPAKPGRKKPPSFLDVDSSRDTSGLDMDSAAFGESSDIDTDDSESVRFPLFPGISEKHHHRIGLFSKKKKPRDTGVVYDPELPPDENEQPLAPIKSKNPSAAVPSVKLRTTMRKESKRKEKKTAFNEDKPWKNHGDLDVISDAQRKRYEGLWVSNKGLYLDRVATKLVGVDIGKEDDTLSKSVRDYSEREISERAAKLSASLNLDFDQTDLKELHGLESVSVQNLIHGSVVKKLWSRSNLPRETLLAIWDLVDCRKDGTLNKAEFVVGMWLVDQCLYGRKLPKTVNKLVWSSLGGLRVNVVIKKKRR